MTNKMPAARPPVRNPVRKLFLETCEFDNLHMKKQAIKIPLFYNRYGEKHYEEALMAEKQLSQGKAVLSIGKHPDSDAEEDTHLRDKREADLMKEMKVLNLQKSINQKMFQTVQPQSVSLKQNHYETAYRLKDEFLKKQSEPKARTNTQGLPVVRFTNRPERKNVASQYSSNTKSRTSSRAHDSAKLYAIPLINSTNGKRTESKKRIKSVGDEDLYVLERILTIKPRRQPSSSKIHQRTLNPVRTPKVQERKVVVHPVKIVALKRSKTVNSPSQRSFKR